MTKILTVNLCEEKGQELVLLTATNHLTFGLVGCETTHINYEGVTYYRGLTIPFRWQDCR